MGILQKTAKAALSASAKAAKRLVTTVCDNRETLKQAANGGARAVVSAGAALAHGASKAGDYLIEHREDIAGGASAAGNAVIAAGRGAAGMACDAGSVAVYNKNRIAELAEKLHQQGVQYQELLDTKSMEAPVLESLAVGGSLLVDIIRSHEVPADIQRAYELAYPHEAAAMTFNEKAGSLQGEELMGVVNGVKGKLFEMKYVDYLNNGILPEGYTAHLAESSTQPGWDIAVNGPDGHVAEVLQMKAADSVSYVSHALERYPDIHVVTTDEVYDKLVLHGAAEGVSNSGISNGGLEDYIGSAIDAQTIEMHWAPPLIAFALHAFTAYRLDGDLHDKACHFGERAGKSWLCYLLGGAVAATTQVGWIGLITGIAARYLAGRGRGQRELCQEMERQLTRNELLLADIKAV